jgi:hypothetical protein
LWLFGVIERFQGGYGIVSCGVYLINRHLKRFFSKDADKLVDDGIIGKPRHP